jgi:2,5-diketo-D-gluconate reductase B
MEYIISGSVKIPVLGFGTWKLTGDDCIRATNCALETGYRHIDTAQIYENEAEIGTALSGSNIPRADIFLTTKVWTENLKDGDLQRSVDASLKKLKTDYVDLLLIHWPINDVPFAEQLNALKSVQDAGKARLIGVSNFTTAQLREAVEVIGAPIVNNQVEYHPYLSQKPVLDFTRSHGMFLTAYSPLARGQIMDDPTLSAIAKKHGKTIGQIVLRWLLQHGDVAAIPKAASEAHIKSNFDIFDFVLSHEEVAAIHALARPDGRLISPAWGPVWDKAA